jgi:hypothetical protein
MKSRFLPTAANSFGFLAVALFLFAPIEAWSQPITPSALPAPPRAAAPATPTPAVPLAAAPTPDLRETSVTLAQIVERQDANFARMKSARGGVVWRKDTLDTATQRWVPSSMAVLFSFETTRSVNVVLRHVDGRPFPLWENSAWKDVVAAAHVSGDEVYTASQPEGASRPEVELTPFNPAVHENNPLIAFTPRMLGEERITLRQLLEAQDKFPTRPTVSRIETTQGPRLVIEFLPGDGSKMYYLINPEKGWLAEEIGRTVDKRHLFRTRMLIGKTGDGIWIPAKRERFTYDNENRAWLREFWYYDLLESNVEMRPLELTLAFFRLPMSTVIKPIKPATGKPAAPPPVQRTPAVTPYAR